VNIWAIVPVKPLNRAKSRLASVLTAEQRETFSLQMLENTLLTLKSVEGIKGVLVISRDSAALAFARKLDVYTVSESGAPELNTALTRATQVVITWHARGVLVLASDIPLMRVEDIEGMLALATRDPAVVVAPDRHEDGTNAVLIRPPGLIPFRFGEDSLRRHLAEAHAVGASVRIYRSPTMSLDVDTPSDLDLYRESLGKQGINQTAGMETP
jgi:2-phospho-L-lactate guanylyltransferase